MAIAGGEQLYKNFIGGGWQESSSGRPAVNTNPATGEILGRVPLSTREEAQAAIRAAETAFPKWRDTPGPVRGRILFKVLDVFERSIDRLAEGLTREEGKTFSESKGGLFIIAKIPA